ncbi:MAG: phosphate ABC transporter permease PstA [Thermodesulfobacteriota bacterium]|nr:MAG: phosphate ABC transporter permease PstA [Thermodesulfobacteriota bacterium]
MKRPLLEEKIFKALMLAATFIVVGSLALILATVFIKGFSALSIDMLIKTPQGGFYMGKEGGILNAITGSLVLSLGATALAFILSLPLALYLNLYLRKSSRFAFSARFLLDILFGVPSIVYGAFGFIIMVFFGLRASLLAGVITVALLVVPVMTRAMDEVLKTVPFDLKEVSLALGANRLETGLKVMLRQALPGLLTAVLISFGRAISDAASVLFTAGFTDSLPYSLFQPVATLPLAIFFQLGTPFPEVQERGYASALVLTVIILAISIAARIISRRFTKNTVK